MCEEHKVNKDNIIESSLSSETIKKKQEIQKQESGIREMKIPSPWKINDSRREAVSRGVAMFQTSFGLYAAVPLLCKGEDCPYATLFPDLHDGKVEDGERCPVEVSFIMSKYNQYVNELGISEEDAVDMSLLRDLIDFDIQILRADNKIALDGGFTEMQVVAVSESSGEPIYREDISATANYKDKIQAKRNKTLEMLNSTRKDKAGTKINHVLDPSSYATSLLKQIQDTSKVAVTADFEELEVIEDVPYIQQLERSKINSVGGEESPDQLSFEEMYEID